MSNRLLSSLPLLASRSRIAPAVTSCAAALAMAGAALPAAATSVAGPVAAGTSRMALGSAAAQSVLLLNGDRVLTRPGPGGRAIGTLLAAPRTGAVITLRMGSRTEYIPADALPYLGHGLDPSLFELAGLRRAEVGGRLRVRVTFAGRRPELPGVTITHSAARSADGYLTGSSARIFGVALQRQFQADHGSASYGRDGMFGGGVTISLAGAAAPPRARPQFPMHELTVTGTNLAGQADSGDLLVVINADDWHRFGDLNEIVSFFYHGMARYAVPAGHYWAVGWFGSGRQAPRMVVLPQFTVRGSHTQVRLAARAASSELRVATPRPSVLQSCDVTLVRTGLHGTSDEAGVDGFGPLWVSPTARKPSVGSLRDYTKEMRSSPARARGVPYGYNVAFAGPAGIIPVQRWVVAPASLATVTERYYQDVRSTGIWLTLGGYPQQLHASAFPIAPVPLPGLQIQYMSGGASILWRSSYTQFLRSGNGGSGDSVRRLLPGQKLTEAWNKYPLHPQPAVQLLHGRLASLAPQYPSAYRAGGKLWLSPTPFSDNEPGHTGPGFLSYGPGVKVSGSYAIYQDGVRIAHGSAVNGIPAVPLSHKPALIRFQLSAARRSASFPLSPASQTVWTWRSAPQPGAKLPPSWYCVSTSNHCAVQPMMTLDYNVTGMALNGTTAPGRQVIRLTVGHLQLGGHARITGATVRVSYDGGRTWRNATVTSAGAGNFTISFTAPVHADVTLRTGATDAAGGAITETIQDAYRS